MMKNCDIVFLEAKKSIVMFLQRLEKTGEKLLFDFLIS